MAVVQSLSCVQLFGAPWTAARQASLSFTISQSLLRLTALGRAEHRSPTGAGGEALHTGAVIPLHTGWQGMRETLIWHLPALLALGWPFVPKSLHGSGREVPQALLGSCSGKFLLQGMYLMKILKAIGWYKLLTFILPYHESLIL